MPWQPLPRIAFAVATYPFPASSPADLPLEIGDELYIIEETADGNWLRGYLVAPPSLLAGLTSVKGQTLEARVFSGIFPRSCVEVREMLGESEDTEPDDDPMGDGTGGGDLRPASDSAKSGLTNGTEPSKDMTRHRTAASSKATRRPLTELPNGTTGALSIPVKRDRNAPRPAAPVPMLKIGDETPTSASEPLIDEIASCLREWHSKDLHELLLSQNYAKLDQLSQLITSLNFNRQQFLHNVLTSHEYDELREKSVWDLVRVNKLCGGEVIVRDPAARGRVLTGDDSVVEVTKLQSVMTLLDEAPQPPIELSSLHHLLLDVKGFAGSSSDETTLVLYLLTKSPRSKSTNLSECFSIEIPAGGTLDAFSQDAATKTLFTDLSALDIGDGPSADVDLYLVVKVMASQRVTSYKPLSRAGTATDNMQTRDGSKPPQSSGRASRRSLMWGSKTARSAFSRSSNMPKMDAVSEWNDGRPYTSRTESRDSRGPPSTAGSRSDLSSDFPHTAPRTVGFGILKLNAIMKQDEEVEQVVSVWSPSSGYTTEKQSGEDWDPIIGELTNRPAGNYEKSKRGERLHVALKAFNHSDADDLIKATPTILSGVSKTSRIGFSGAPTKPRSDIYFTINTAVLTQQNLLSRFRGSAVSATELPASFQGSNLQITLEVRNASGQRFENCIYSSSNTEAATTFKSTVTERGESWNQTVRLSLPVGDVAKAHVVMFLADMPSPPFAIAYMPLWNQQAFIRDGSHGLLLYKIDENTSTALAGPAGRGGYLSTPWAPRGTDIYASEVTGPLAVLVVDTFLCSTRFSQDRVILGLLSWKELSEEDLTAVLNQLMFVPEIEIVKLLNDILDGLFGILVEHSGNDVYEDLVFTALVRVLDIVHDRRFNLVPLLDDYSENQFRQPFATPCLIRSFTRLLANPTEPQSARKLRSTFKVVQHILKFIAQARAQQKAKEAKIGITSSPQGFSRHLRLVFKALDEMMQNTAPVLVGSQTLAVQHFHTWLPELHGLLDTEEILHIAIDFMDSCANVKGKLILYKLVLIINYSKLDFFMDPEQQSALSANTVRWISPHWGHAAEISDQWREQIRLCCSILASQIDYLGPEIPDHVPRIIDSYLAILASPQKPRARLSLLFPSAYPFPTKPVESFSYDESLAELSALLSAMAGSAAGLQLELSETDLTAILENLLRVQMSILTGEAFPQGWLSVHIYHHKSTMRILQYVASILLESCLPEPDEAEGFNTELWKLFFTTLLKLVGSTSLALETFPEQKRRAVWKIAGDVREHGAELLRKTWEAIGWETSNEERARYGLTKIGGYQVQYVPTLVGPIVELCLSVHEGLRRMAVEVLQTMIVSEWTLSEDLSVIQTEMIDCLDHFFKSKPLTESILQKLFIGELLERFDPLSEIPNEPLYAAMRELVGTLDEFLDLLVAVHSGDANGESSNIINRLRLMEFLRDMQKEEIFVRYVHQLASLEAESRNNAEAGLALRLHADLYDWDPTRQIPSLREPNFPAQTPFERKERIYFDMIKHFEDGESWSNALTAYKELQHQYENNIFDFAKLARTERAIASIYEKVSKSEKLVPRYFKVVYKGLGFPAASRDKEFVYQGAPNERASAFTDRMQEQYPSAKIVTSGDVDEVEGQFLVVSAIAPHRDLSHPVFQRTRVPQVIRDFLLNSHPQQFAITMKRSTSGPVHEHFAEKLVYTTAEPFPTILRRTEVVEMQEVKLNAKETGLERIVRKTQEMTTLEKRLADGDQDTAQLLVDAVTVSINPISDQSVACYRKLLPDGDNGESDGDDDSDDEDKDDEEESELEPQDVAIKMALVDHAMMLKRCLALFARSANPALAHKAAELQEYYESTFAPEIAIFAPPQIVRDAVSTPSPTIRGSSSSNDQSPQFPNIASPLSGFKGEEASTSIIRQVSMRQRGARLSFLGGKKKEHDGSQEPEHVNVVPDTTSNHKRSLSKDGHGQGLFRALSIDRGKNVNGGERRGSAASGDKADRVMKQDNNAQGKEAGMVRRTGSMRKRLSMLKLGMKGGKTAGPMGSVDEE